MESLRRRYGSADYRSASGVMRQVLVIAVNESYESELRALSAPVCLVWGANDHDAPVTVAQAAASVLRTAGTSVEVNVIDGVGHFLPLESPGSLRAAVDEMLRK
jgi:pimeloyl-ACP methyl ester carboxylesterase